VDQLLLSARFAEVPMQVQSRFSNAIALAFFDSIRGADSYFKTGERRLVVFTIW